MSEYVIGSGVQRPKGLLRYSETGEEVKFPLPDPKPIILEGWISVKDRLPEPDQRVIVLYFDSLITMCDYRFSNIEDKYLFFDDDSSELEPDYWLPFTVKLPEK